MHTDQVNAVFREIAPQIVEMWLAGAPKMPSDKYGMHIRLTMMLPEPCDTAELEQAFATLLMVESADVSFPLPFVYFERPVLRIGCLSWDQVQEMASTLEIDR